MKIARAVLGLMLFGAPLFALATQSGPTPGALCAEGRFDRARDAARLRIDSAPLALSPDPAEDALLRAELRGTADYCEYVLSLEPAAREALTAAHAVSHESVVLYRERRYAELIDALLPSIETRQELAFDRDPTVFEDLLRVARSGIFGARPDVAEAAARRAVEHAERRYGHEHPRSAEALDWLGFAYSDAERTDEARALLLEAHGLFEALEWNGLARTQSLDHLTQHFRYAGDLPEAWRFLVENVAHTERRYGATSREHLRVLTTTSTLLLTEGDFERAEPVIHRVLAAGLDEGDTIRLVALSNLGALHMERGEADRAEAAFREYHDVPSLGALERAQAGLNLAAALSAQGGDRAAADLVRRALAETETLYPDGHFEVFRARTLAADVLESAGRFEEASELRAILAETHGRTENAAVREARSAHRTGMLALEEGDLDGARADFERALVARREVWGAEHHDVAATLSLLAEIETKAGDHERAVELATEAATIFERSRVRAGSGTSRVLFFRAHSPHRLLAWNRLQLGDHEAAWAAAERERGRVLLELLSVASERAADDRQAALERAVLDRETELATVRDATSEGSNARVVEARAALSAAQLELREWQGERERPSPALAFDRERVQAQLAPDEAVVGWMLGEWLERTGGWLWILRSSGPVRWLELEPREAGARTRDLERLYEALSDTGTFVFPVDPARSRALGRDVFERLVAPAEPALEKLRSLIVVPSEDLAGLPIEALVDEGGALFGERFTISYAPSATVLAWLRERLGRRVPSADAALVVADPPFREDHLAQMRDEQRSGRRAGDPERGSSLPRLPRSLDEAQAVAEAHAEATLLVGPRASEPEFVELAKSGALSGFDTVHLATHARIDAATPERSEIVLSQVGLPDPVEAALAGREIFDGRVSVAEILADWSLDADLVTLSACETGLGRTVRGEGLVGFIQALLRRGARSVVVSLWQVDDRATSMLMGRFYERRAELIEEGVERANADALADAKRWLRTWSDDAGRTPYAHPAYWAPFVLVGVP